MTDKETEENDDLELFDFIRGKGRFWYLGGGITTYPNCDDERHPKLHDACLRLEEQKLIFRRIDEGDYVLWIPVMEE